MPLFSKLKSYLNTEIETMEEYTAFQKLYIRYLRSLCNECGWVLAKTLKNHFCFSAFIQNEQNQYVYLSISDVRYFNKEWYGHILIRRAEHDKDYHGGKNYYVGLPSLEVGIDCLFQGLGI